MDDASGVIFHVDCDVYCWLGRVMIHPVPGAESVRLLSDALTASLGASVIRWQGPPYWPTMDTLAWQLTMIPRYLFSVSTDAGQLPEGRYNLQISIMDDSLENGDIFFWDDVDLEEACDLARRYARGEIVERWVG